MQKKVYKVRQSKMKSIFVLILLFSIGYCQKNDTSDSIELLLLLAEEQLVVKNTSLNVVRSFALNVESVLVWRQRVNNMSLSGHDSKAAQAFLDYVRYAFRIEDAINDEMLLVNLPRFNRFKTFYDYSGTLTTRQIYAANANIEIAILETIKRRKRIEKFIANVDEKVTKIKEKIFDLRKKMSAIISDSMKMSDEEMAKEKLFDDLKDAAQNVMELITGKRITKSLMKPMMDEIKDVIKIEDKLVKQLDRICLTVS